MYSKIYKVQELKTKNIYAAKVISSTEPEIEHLVNSTFLKQLIA
jgi:hypothetical protein